jgi:hypothetical protein
MVQKRESPVGKELRRLVIGKLGTVTEERGQPPHPLVAEDLEGIPGGWTLGEELAELSTRIRENIRDLSANLAVFSEELGVPIPKMAVELVSIKKEEGLVLPKGLLTGIAAQLREVTSLLDADAAILSVMQDSLTAPKGKPARD